MLRAFQELWQIDKEREKQIRWYVCLEPNAVLVADKMLLIQTELSPQMVHNVEPELCWNVDEKRPLLVMFASRQVSD